MAKKKTKDKTSAEKASASKGKDLYMLINNGAQLGLARDHYPDESPSFPEISDPKKRAYLVALCRTARFGAAAKVAGVDVRTAYNWRQKDPEFAAAENTALDIGGRLAEDEAWRRATEGVEEPVYQQGRLVGTKRVLSDTLLIFMLKGAHPQKYRERLEHTGRDGGPIELRSVRSLTDEELNAELEALERAEAVATQGTSGKASGR